MYYGMTIAVELVNTSAPSHGNLTVCVCVVVTYKVYCLNNFQVYCSRRTSLSCASLAVLHRCCVFHREKVCDNTALNKSVGTIF